MSEEEQQKHREYMKEYRKIRFNKVLKKLKENNELKSVEVDVVTSLIKDEVEGFFYAEIYTDDNSEAEVSGFK